VPANQQQAEAWNGPESAHFVHHADRYDRQLEPFTQALLEWARPEAHHVVLDVGCGSGASTLAAATRAGRVTGVDFSERSSNWHGVARKTRGSATPSS
jgi:ubiquinone/menaquinone biosynthesis C-methylase UbiE